MKKRDAEGGYWPHLTADRTKHHWLKVDFNRWRDEESSDEDDEMGGGGPGVAGGNYDLAEVIFFLLSYYTLIRKLLVNLTICQCFDHNNVFFYPLYNLVFYIFKLTERIYLDIYIFKYICLRYNKTQNLFKFHFKIT